MNFIRSLFFNIYFYSITILCILTYGVACYFTTSLAMPGLRHWARATLWGLKNIADIKIEVRGAELIPKNGALVASASINFRNNFDVCYFSKSCSNFEKRINTIAISRRYGQRGRAYSY